MSVTRCGGTEAGGPQGALAQSPAEGQRSGGPPGRRGPDCSSVEDASWRAGSRRCLEGAVAMGEQRTVQGCVLALPCAYILFPWEPQSPGPPVPSLEEGLKRLLSHLREGPRSLNFHFQMSPRKNSPGSPSCLPAWGLLSLIYFAGVENGALVEFVIL